MAILQTTTGDSDDRSDAAGAARDELRPSFVERDAFRTALSQAYADGRIDDAEFERRSTLLETGRHAADLRQALADLPQPEVEFPTTLTRAEAIEHQRRRARKDSPKLSRRVLLAGGAAAVGFVLAGGVSTLFGREPQGDDSEKPTETAADFIADSAALKRVLTKITDKGYKQFTSIDIDPDVVEAAARSLKSSRGIDSITAYEGGDIDITPSGRLNDGVKPFTVDVFALDLIPAMVRAAEKKLGSRQGARVELGTDTGITGSEPVITVLIEGDDYGDGGGELRWTADGKELISIHRAGEE